MTGSIRESERTRARIQGEVRSDPLVPIPPAIQAKRRRFVRLVTTIAILGGAGLSAIPARQMTWRESITTRGAVQVHEMTFHREVGIPFPTTTLTMGSAREIQSVSVHPFGLIGNVAVALFAAIGISLLRRRRRDDRSGV